MESAEERYSFAFQGKPQTLDHVLLTRGLQSKVGDFRYAHFDNDYYAVSCTHLTLPTTPYV